MYIHKMDTSKIDGDHNIEVLYHVAVDGKPVSAITATKDMTLVTDEEVREELGYPFLIKAERKCFFLFKLSSEIRNICTQYVFTSLVAYLKPTQPQGLSSARNTWIFIGASIIGCLIFLLLIAFLTLGFTKRKRVGSPISMGVENRQHIFERGVGTENKGFVQVETTSGYVISENV